MDLQEIKKEARRVARKKNQPYRIYFLSRINPYVTYIFTKTSVTPNQITLSGFFFVILSIFFLSKSEPIQWIIGWILLQMYLIFDCSDGEVARIKGMETKFGGFLDNFLHPVSNALVVIGTGLGTYNIYNSIQILFLTSGASALAVTLSLCRSNILLSGEESGIPTGKKAYHPLAMLLLSPGGFFHPIILLTLAEIAYPVIPFRILYIPGMLLSGIFILIIRLIAFYRGSVGC